MNNTYIGIEHNGRLICEGDTIADAITQAREYFRDDYDGELDVELLYMDGGEAVFSTTITITWDGYEPSQYEQHNTLNKNTQGVI